MTPKLNLMSMEELSDAATSQDGSEETREMFKRELEKREKRLFGPHRTGGWKSSARPYADYARF